MSDPREGARQKAEATYNAAADHFDGAPLAFWERYGSRTVERLGLPRGAHVLDVACGSGASALPAARAVGPEGHVIGADLAEELLKLGQAKAAAAGYGWLEFRRGDMAALGFPDRHFDAVVCVFGIFFVPDMEAQAAELWRMVKRGGQLAVTTWGPEFWAPAYQIWLDAVHRHRPDLDSAFNPWDRIATPGTLARLLTDAGIKGARILAEEGYQPLSEPADFWTIALGSGLRWTIDRMGPETSAVVRDEIIRELATRQIDHIKTNVIYAIARR